MGRAGTQSLGVISQGCLVGSKAAAAGSLRLLRSGEVLARLAVPWASPFPAPHPPSAWGARILCHSTRDIRAASADPFRSPPPSFSFTLFQASPTETLWSKLGREGREAPALQDPASSFKASSPPPTPQTS